MCPNSQAVELHEGSDTSIPCQGMREENHFFCAMVDPLVFACPIPKILPTLSISSLRIIVPLGVHARECMLLYVLSPNPACSYTWQLNCISSSVRRPTEELAEFILVHLIMLGFFQSSRKLKGQEPKLNSLSCNINDAQLNFALWCACATPISVLDALSLGRM